MSSAGHSEPGINADSGAVAERYHALIHRLLPACQARMMRRMLRPDQLVEIDALPLYRKYSDRFEIDSVPETERNAVAEEVAHSVLGKIAALRDSAAVSPHVRQGP